MDYLYEFEDNDIYTRYAKDESADKSSYSMHIHDRCELYYFLEGNASYIVEGREYPLKRGDMLLMRPGEAHCARILGKGTYERYAINFPLSIFDHVDPQRRLMAPFTERELGIGNKYSEPGFMELFKKMCSECTDNYERYILLYSGIIEIMRNVAEKFYNKEMGAKRELSQGEKILEYVNTHITDELSLPELAKRFYISRSQFCRIFKQASGASPFQYILAKRLIMVGELMRGGMGASEAALACGFNDYSSFYRAYVKRYGRGPRENTSGK
ncbi:MAG: AraC family transcriptional regulator [Lachnospiraceae bacterium]|nr:AraC family transcriptional regulator [Lachnospiraceae bacterium]